MKDKNGISAGHNNESGEPKKVEIDIHSIDIRKTALAGLLLISIFYTLYFAKSFFMPIVLAVLLSWMLQPVVRILKRFHIPDALGGALILLMVAVLLGYSVFKLSGPASKWAQSVPQNFRKVEGKLLSFRKPMQEVSKAAEELGKITQLNEEEKTQEVQLKEKSFADTLLSNTQEFFAIISITVVLLYFLLASGDLFLRKLVRVLPTLKDKKKAVEIARHTEQHISMYLLTVTTINIFLGLAIAAAMFLLKMPNPLLWGAMAGVLNFIPYLGAVVGISTVGLVALVQFDSVSYALLAPLSYFLINFVEGNFITPVVLGQRLTLNPVVVFISLFFWWWLWGLPGAIMAVPLLVIFKIICDHVEPLTAVGEFLGK
ncbi:MAG: AI-2E family transporter [Calditrichia bacterium]